MTLLLLEDSDWQIDTGQVWAQPILVAIGDRDHAAELAVAVIPTLVLDSYIRALVAGAAGVVYVDTSSAIMADVVQAAIEGEVLLPRQAAQSMAALARRERPPSDLDESEQELLQAVAAGRTIVDLAKELHYSERTVRRHLHSLYIKLGVRNRAEAIACAARLGLTDT